MSRQCKHLCEIDIDRDEPLRYCRLVTNKKCFEKFNHLINCNEYEPEKKKRKWIPQFITEEEMTL